MITAEPDSVVVRHLIAKAWTVLASPEPPAAPASEPVVESWLDSSDVYHALRRQFRGLKQRALRYAESWGWNPLYWFRPRPADWVGVLLLTQSGDLAVRIVSGQRRYRITAQGRMTLNSLRFMRVCL